ncbi:sugar ABC transporter substrate-binding protein [Deinococcus aerius]|uniref:Sugar ABC transporter substrate-binding protein n=1 Tax=Deinococcus aerius TaxID=200253 RepID=A0A2I9CS07_9DEIO|nr:sugar ABC transporter substrate-binding protein [Deinococcus aerius]GBF04383.1 sugar ABC transporter substrate-binding protein [Deinococcus aerius]
MKKTLLALTTLALASGALAADPPFPKAPSGKVTLEVWSWVPGLDKTVQAFEKAYPNIDVKVTNLGGGPQTYTKLRTALQAGSGAPDVAQIEYGFLPAFVDLGGLEDLSKYGANNYKKYFVPWTWGQVSPDGKAVFAIPQDTGPFAMVYRTDLLQKYGVAVPKTWAEYEKAADTVRQKSGGKVKFGNFYSTFAPWFMALAWADGGQFFRREGDGWVQTLNNPSAKKVLNYWYRLIKKGDVGTLQAFTADYWNAAGAGQVATNMEAAWGPGGYAGSLKDKSAGQWRAANLPQWTAGGTIRSGNWGGSSNVVTTQSKNKEAATLFALWLNLSQSAISNNWTNGGLFPASEAGLDLPVLHDKTKNPSKFFGGQDISSVYARASRGVNVNFQWAPWFPFVNDNFNKQMDLMLRGRLTPDQALDAWQRESLAEAKKQGYTVR